MAEEQSNIEQEKLIADNVSNLPGVYLIINKINNKVYVGSTLTVRKRLINHKSLLYRDKHHSYKLQLSFNKYGDHNFKFEVLEYVYFPNTYNKTIKLEYLECLEQYYINKYNSYQKGYNVSKTPKIIGNTNSKDSIAKGIETRRKNGSYNISEETRAKRSLSLKNSNVLKSRLLENAKKRIKKIYQYDLEGNFIREWESKIIASQELKIYVGLIHKNLLGIFYRCKTFIFSYKKENKVKSYKQCLIENPKVKPRTIHMYDINQKLIKTYINYKECAIDNNLKKSTILTYLNKNKLCNNHILKYGSAPK